MRRSYLSCLSYRFILCALVVHTTTANAAPIESPVILAIDNTQSHTLRMGTDFTIDVWVCPWLGQITGVDYSFVSTANFQIVSRDVSIGPLSDSLLNNNQITGSISSGKDLGAVVQDVNKPIGPGAFAVAEYIIGTIGVPEGQYVISLVSGNVVGVSLSFNEQPMDRLDGIMVTILPLATEVPEPSMIITIAAITMIVAKGRRGK